MPANHDSNTLLVVDDDEILAQVITRVLTQEGRQIVQANSVARALESAAKHPPRVALIDLCLPDGDGVKLGQQLQERYAGIRVLLMTAFPLRLQDSPELKKQFSSVLIKPLDVPALRSAVAHALEEGPSGQPAEPAEAANAELATRHTEAPTYVPLRSPSRDRGQVHGVPPSIHPMAQPKERTSLRSIVRVAGVLAIGAFVVGGLAVATGQVQPPWKGQGADKAPPPARQPLGVFLVPDRPHTLAVPEEVRRALGIRKGAKDVLAVAEEPKTSWPLVMSGSTALDPTRLMRIRARFAPSPSSAEVVAIARRAEDNPNQMSTGETVYREIRSGDEVKKGELLAVFRSVDVGNKKNDLIDAIYQLRLDEEILKNAETKAGAVPEVFLWTARRNVQGDINLVNRSVSTLKTWGISDEDIQAVRDAAERVKERGGKHDKERDELWARVEIRAPEDGIVIERNVALHEIVVDNTTNLFQIAKLDRLSVFANVPEDDLPALHALPTRKRTWTIETVGAGPIRGAIDDIGYLIDPNQHTAVVKGHIDNPTDPEQPGQYLLLGGQFIKATVPLDPPRDVVEVPIDAVVEDGHQSVVFVQAEPDKHPDYYTLRRVEVTHRLDKVAFIRSKSFAAGEQRMREEEELGVLPKEPLHAGERILRTAVGELKAALLDKEDAQPKEPKTRREGEKHE
jgi:cobalt-zinc-cadmium efflux system membrane fusion protein